MRRHRKDLGRSRTGSGSKAHDYYVKSAAEMRAIWDDKHGLPEACDNTLLIAERCR